MLSIQMSVMSGTAAAREAPPRRRRSARRSAGDLGAGIAAVLISVTIGVAVQISLPAAVALVVLIVAATVVAREGWMGIPLVLVVALPWTVIFGTVEPKLAETFTAGAAVVALLVVAKPRLDGSTASRRLRWGMVLFYVPVLIGLARAPGSAQFIEAAKYFVFPFTVLAVTAATERPAVARLGRAALISGAIAVLTNLLLGAAGLNHSYYQAGDIQGLGGQHDLALLAGAVTAAALSMRPTVTWLGTSAIGTVATVATGVRSTLPGLFLAVLVRMFRQGVRLRNILLVCLLVAAVAASGVADVVAARFAYQQRTGQFSSFASLGSGRGGIWTTAVQGWWTASPADWVIGTGLRSVNSIERRATGNTVVGQSDVIQAGVELGLLGLAGLILIWWTLIARARSKLPLLVLLPFSLFNGALEYGAPLVVTLLLTLTAEPARPSSAAQTRPLPASAARDPESVTA
jgi:O-Antigen ligase